MPIFFFDTHNGDKLDRDPDGQDFPDRHVARQEALTALAQMANDEMPGGDMRNLFVNVRDETGRPIYTACLALTGRWLE